MLDCIDQYPGRWRFANKAMPTKHMWTPTDLSFYHTYLAAAFPSVRDHQNREQSRLFFPPHVQQLKVWSAHRAILAWKDVLNSLTSLFLSFYNSYFSICLPTSPPSRLGCLGKAVQSRSNTKILAWTHWGYKNLSYCPNVTRSQERQYAGPNAQFLRNARV